MFLWGGDVGFVRGTERPRDTIFQMFGENKLTRAKTYIANICVRCQVINGNGSVSC